MKHLHFKVLLYISTISVKVFLKYVHQDLYIKETKISYVVHYKKVWN